MSGGWTKRARLVVRTALMAATVALAALGCGDDGGETQLDRRQAQLEASAIYDFLFPPPTSNAECTVELKAGTDPDGDAAMIQDAVDAAMAFDVICLWPGVYDMHDPGMGPTEGTIVVDAPHSLTLRGLGGSPEEVELDFQGQTGAEGIRATAPGIWVENLWVHDADDAGIRISGNSAEENPSVVRKVKVSWGNDQSVAGNGARGVWIEQAEYAIVEFVDVIGATYGGVVVSLASQVIVRDSLMTGNSVGIVVENSSDVEVVSNTTRNNVAGILSLQEDLPASQRNERILFFRNDSYSNNRAQFAAGGAPASAPTGTGLMVVAGTDIEFRDNWTWSNGTSGMLILSNLTPDMIETGTYPSYTAGYNPLPLNVYLNDNLLEINSDNFLALALSQRNGLAVSAAFRTQLSNINSVTGPKPTYQPLPAFVADNPATPTVNEANDPNTAFVAELRGRPIILDGTVFDFFGLPPGDPTYCIGTDGADSPISFILTDFPRRGYPNFNDPANPLLLRQAEFQCVLPELPTISFP